MKRTRSPRSSTVFFAALLAAALSVGVTLTLRALMAQETEQPEETPAEALPPEQPIIEETPAEQPPAEEPSEPATFTTGGSPQNFVYETPPASLDRYYPPSDKHYLFANAMDSLGRYFGTLSVDVSEGDWTYAEFSYRRFALQFKKVGEMVPEWSEYFPQDPVVSLAGAVGLQAEGAVCCPPAPDTSASPPAGGPGPRG